MVISARFLRRKSSPRKVVGTTIDTVGAIINTGVGQQDLQQRNASPIFRPTVADSSQRGGTDATRPPAPLSAG